MAKVIDIPVAVELETNVFNGAVLNRQKMPMTFLEWSTICVDNYAEMAKGAKAARQAARIVDALENANGTCHLEEAEFEILKAAVEKQEWKAGLNRKMIPFYEAIEKAQDVKK